MVIPYLASARWYACWLKELWRGKAPEEAVSVANAAIEARDLARARIFMPGKGATLLSVPLEGGASTLRGYTGEVPLMLSDHGDWRRTHPSAISTCYSKAPYYHHISDRILPIYRNRELKCLEDFNAALHREIAALLSCNLSFSEVSPLVANGVIEERGNEILGFADPDISIIHWLMHHGQEAVFALIALQRL